MHVDAPSDAGSVNGRPTISCLMVTRQRLTMAKRAIDCYVAQDYEPRELVIVSDGYEDFEALREYATRMSSTPVQATWAPSGSMPLGCLRNRAIALARGEIICNWDDDDLSHPRRLSLQFEQMRREGARACFMTDHLHLFTRARSLYWCDWTRPRGQSLASSTLPGTLMCYKRDAPAYPETGALARRSGDAFFMRSLSKSGHVAKLSGLGWLYVYVCHGQNLWAESHHMNIVRVTGMEASDLVSRQQQLSQALAAYPLCDEVVVRDYLGAPVLNLVASASVL